MTATALAPTILEAKAMTRASAPASLEEAILQLINLGEKDPLTITQKLVKRHGDDWLREQAASRADDFAAAMTRYFLSAQRRTSQQALKPGDQLATAELKTRSFWVPEVGWVRANELTPDDLYARAQFYERLASAAARHAAWCRTVADAMVEQGAATLGAFKGTLPALPDADAPELGA